MSGGARPTLGAQVGEVGVPLSVVAPSQTFAGIWEREFSNCSFKVLSAHALRGGHIARACNAPTPLT